MASENTRNVTGPNAVVTGAADRRRPHPTAVERPQPAAQSGANGDGGRRIELVRDSTPAPVARVASEVQPRSRSELINRAVNLAVACLALVILAPVMLLIAIAIRITSRGPVLYSQKRVGLDRRRDSVDALYDRRETDTGGCVFTIYKFRSMRVNAEQHSGEVWATREDPRITAIGRFLRRSRLDELPQLVNVVKGDMNIVGPRPERPSIFARLREDIDEYSMRQRTRPGITGWAQINHSYDASLEDVRTKVKYDLEYLQRQSLAEDLKIMVRTVPVMLFKKGGW